MPTSQMSGVECLLAAAMQYAVPDLPYFIGPTAARRRFYPNLYDRSFGMDDYLEVRLRVVQRSTLR